MEKLKGLAIIYDPHNLYQFVWYYCNKGKQKKWDALCLPNGYKGEYMHTFCEHAEIFSKVYKYDTDFSNMGNFKKLATFMSMFGHFIIGQRKRFCKKLINSYVRLDDYDEIVVIADVGVVSGACVALGQEKKVIILEDGIGDYGERPKFISKEKFTSLYFWQGFIMAHMGYCSPGWFELKTDKYCIKYASQPDKMKYVNYKEIRLLYDRKTVNIELFDSIIKKIYPAICNINFDLIDTVLLTRPLDDFVDDTEKYIQRIEHYINENCKSVLIKRHPRESIKYQFNKEVAVQEIDNSVPAEVMLPYLVGKKILLITTSAIMLYLKSYDLNCQVIMFEGMYEESLSSNTKFRAKSLDDAFKFSDEFAKDHYKLVIL